MVAKEFNNGIDQATYAATPPVEALKLLTVRLSQHVSENEEMQCVAPDDNNSSVMNMWTYKRAYFCA